MFETFSIFFSIKIVTFNDKDSQWMTQYLKSEVHRPNNIYQEYQKKRHHNTDDFIFLENVMSEVSELIFNKKRLL